MANDIIQVVLLSPMIDAVHTETLNGLRRYRDKHQLPLQFVTHTDLSSADVPLDAYWLIRSSSGHQKNIPQFKPRLPLISAVPSRMADTQIACLFDEYAFGSLAIQHFREAGINHIATIGQHKPRFKERIHGLTLACHQHGIEYTALKIKPDQHFTDFNRSIAEWIHSSSEPIGIYCPIDAQALWLAEMLQKHNISIPNQAAILGTGNHPHSCLVNEPNLSSISYPWVHIGEAMARQLHLIIQGNTELTPILLKPYQVVSRASTAPARITDPLVRKSLRWLRSHLNHPRPLQGLEKELGVSNHTLCRHFKRSLGISPKQKHQQIRLEKARELLLNSNKSIERIAQSCGFSAAIPFGIAFKHRHGISPSEWRKVAVSE